MLDGNLDYIFKGPLDVAQGISHVGVLHEFGKHPVDIEALCPGSDFQDFAIHGFYRTVFLRDKCIILSDDRIL